MAGQGFNRRMALKIMALGAAAHQMGTFSRWSFAHAHKHGPAPDADTKPPRTEPYKPRFFTKAEYATLVFLTDLIIPRDDTPGALEAGVSEFIDFIISHDDLMQPEFRNGIKALEATCSARFDKAFKDLSRAQQIEVLEALSFKAKFRPGEEKSREFFKLARRYTVYGYYTSKPGMEALGVPTLKPHFHSPACPHHDDPEHKNLKKV